MEVLDFASVIAILRCNIPDGSFSNQVDFLYALFEDVNQDSEYGVDFDSARVNRWINGLAKLSPKIINFYKDKKNQRKLMDRIEMSILPIMPDSAMAVQELHDLVWRARNISLSKKKELTDGYTFEDDNDKAIFIAEILCLAMQLRFEPRDVRKRHLKLIV